MTLNLIFAKPIFIKPSQNIQTLLSASLNTVKYFLYTHSHLLCTLISENQGLDKSRSASNLEKKLDLYHKPEKNPGNKLKKKSRCAGPEIFLRFETDLNF